jgi:hypothetical protein
MARTRVREIAGTVADPTLPKTPITIGGKTYNLCFTFGALAEAEASINAELRSNGSEERVNLLVALPCHDMANVRKVFAAALRTFHPEITFPDAIKMVDFRNVYDIALAVKHAWDAAQAVEEESPADPSQPGK